MENMEKLLEIEKKQTRFIRILMISNAILAAAIVIALLVVMPRVVSVMNDAQGTLAEVETLSVNAQKSLEGIDEVVAGANKTVGNAGKIMEDNAEAVEEALSHINEVDFESLNKAIKDLSEVVESLAKVTSIFSR